MIIIIVVIVVAVLAAIIVPIVVCCCCMNRNRVPAPTGVAMNVQPGGMPGTYYQPVYPGPEAPPPQYNYTPGPGNP